jgi:putative multiple sugar transport system substrate-binding protein
VQVLRQAREENILIINYDLLILNSPDIDYYIGFDNRFECGQLKAQFIEDRLDLKNGAGPFNIEVFGGSLDEVNSFWYFEEGMKILQPYIDNGQLVVPSGQVDLEVVTIFGWVGATAATRMENLLVSHYADGKPLHAILSPSDSLSVPIANVLHLNGFGTPERPMPIVTGNNAIPSAIQSILAGQQAHSVFKDKAVLTQAVADVIDQISRGETPTPNDFETFDNGAMIIPAFMVSMESVDFDNWYEVMVASGATTLEALGLTQADVDAARNRTFYMVGR